MVGRWGDAIISNMDEMTEVEVRALLADDHAVVRAGIGNALRDVQGLRVIGEAYDGPSLFSALEALRPDFLVIDVTMPDFEPLSAIRLIRNTYPAMKILVVSAFDDDAYVQGLLAVGVNGYHLKDRSLGELKLAVQRVLSGERWISSNLIDKLFSLGETHSATSVLTPRQQELLALLLQGMDNQTLARETGLSVKTIENHLTRIYRLLNVQSRLEAVRYVREHPEVLSAVASAGAANAQWLPHDQFTVLLVDDNARYRGQLHRMINRLYPHAVICEADATAKALQVAEQAQPQLALVDVILGDEDGIRCVRRLKGLHPLLRIVLITAYPDREFRRLGMEAGAAALLDKKDLDADALRQMIDDVCR